MTVSTLHAACSNVAARAEHQRQRDAPVQQQQRERDAGKEQGVEPAVEKLELQLAAQHLRDHRPASVVRAIVSPNILCDRA